MTAADRNGPKAPRIAALDLARGAAIIAMVIYHTAFDLRVQDMIAADVENGLGWKLLARTTAGTFLLIVGVSLVLSLRSGFRPRPFWMRVAWIVLSAALVSLGTWWFQPETYVRFGILHEIALASVLALPFALYAPTIVVAAAAVVVFAAQFLANDAFNAFPLWLTGLATNVPSMVDFVPPVPWFGVVLAGVVLGRVAVHNQHTLAAWQPRDAVSQALSWAGRWSLLIYLVHQPLIMGILIAAKMVMPTDVAVVRANFMGECMPACQEQRDAAACTAFCGCMFDGLHGTPLFTKNTFEEMSPAERTDFDGIFAACMRPPAELSSPIPAD